MHCSKFILVIFFLCLMTWNTSAHEKHKPTKTECTTHKPTHHCRRHNNNNHRCHRRNRHHHHKPTKTECKTPTPTPTVIPCCQPGSPGFKTSGEIHAFIPPNIETIGNTTPEKCCEECFNKPDCVEWFFAPSNNQCLMSANKDTCNNNIMVPINSSPFSHGGIMRCDADGCLKSKSN